MSGATGLELVGRSETRKGNASQRIEAHRTASKQNESHRKSRAFILGRTVVTCTNTYY